MCYGAQTGRPLLAIHCNIQYMLSPNERHRFLCVRCIHQICKCTLLMRAVFAAPQMQIVCSLLEVGFIIGKMYARFYIAPSMIYTHQ